MLRLIGDVHGLYSRYKKLIGKDAPPSIQVGDMGLGFRHIGGWRDGQFTQNPPHAKMKEGKHKFIRGNHDNPGECKKNSQWIKDGTVTNGIMFIGGALSIDKVFRVKDYNYWEDEELSIKELGDLTDKYVEVKPHTMITHECPEEVAEQIAHIADKDKLQPEFASRTRQAFQCMWCCHSPKLWVFGHWHHSFDHVLRGTRFVCLNELEYRDDLI